MMYGPRGNTTAGKKRPKRSVTIRKRITCRQPEPITICRVIEKQSHRERPPRLKTVERGREDWTLLEKRPSPVALERKKKRKTSREPIFRHTAALQQGRQVAERRTEAIRWRVLEHNWRKDGSYSQTNKRMTTDRE